MKGVKFVFISNYLNHHQIPFCDAMYALLKGSFVFVQTETVEQERIQMGWQEKNSKPYLKLYYEEPEACESLIENCAAALFGGSDEERYIQPRLRAGKPVIRYSERLYKTGQWKAVSPRGLWKKYKDHTRYRRKPVYLLCAGAYVPSDFRIVRAYPEKMLKWGYFPETRHYDLDKLMKGKGWRPDAAEGDGTKSCVEEGGAAGDVADREKPRPAYLLWAARMIDWKHPELPLRLAKYLKRSGHTFHLDIVGGGALEEDMRRLAAEYKVEDVVTFLGYRSPEEVRSLMERADIFLATSDREEGWGAVINEAMNSGCAVVADHMIGAVPWLIRHGDNGMLYEDGKPEELCRLTEMLVKDREFCEKLGRNAVRTITGEWNAATAADRLAAFCVRQGFLQEEDLRRTVDLGLPRQGPCSKAPVVAERGMYLRLMKQKDRREREAVTRSSGM